MVIESDGFMAKPRGYEPEHFDSLTTRRGSFAWEFFQGAVRRGDYFAYAAGRAEAGDLGAQVVTAVYGLALRDAIAQGNNDHGYGKEWEDVYREDIDDKMDAEQERNRVAGVAAFRLLKRIDEKGVTATMASTPELAERLNPLFAAQQAASPVDTTRRAVIGQGLLWSGLAGMAASGGYAATRVLSGEPFTRGQKLAAGGAGGFSGGAFLAGSGIKTTLNAERQFQDSFDFMSRLCREELRLEAPAEGCVR